MSTDSTNKTSCDNLQVKRYWKTGHWTGEPNGTVCRNKIS